MNLPSDLKTSFDTAGEDWHNPESKMKTKPLTLLEEDAARWRFVLAAAVNPAGAEGLALAACRAPYEPGVPEGIQILHVVDQARALLAAVK